MDFAALQVFKAVVDEGGISPAARKLHRVQSNVSTRIQQLEASLGTPLFVREKRRLFLSPAGELFLGYVDQLLKISEQARSAVRGLSRYHERYPAVRVELATGTTDSLVEAVLGRKLEAAFVAECDSAAQVESIPVFLEELVVIAPRSHARIRRAQDVRTDTMIAFPSGCVYRRRLQAWLAGGGIAPSRVLELSSYHAIIACVASGTGIALAPRSVLETIRGARDVSVYRLATSQRKVTTSFVWRRGEASSPLRAFRDQLADFRKARDFRVAASLA